MEIKRSYWWLILSIICWASLGFGYIAQYVFDKIPCAFCLYERKAFIVIGIISLAAFSLSSWPRLMFTLVIASSFGGLAIGYFHLGVEKYWWKGAPTCYRSQEHFNANPASSLKEITDIEPSGSHSSQCDQVNWRIFGISSTVWTVAIFFFLVLLSIISFYNPSIGTKISRSKRG